MSDTEVNFDHDEIDRAVKGLNEFAGRVSMEISAAAEKMVTTAREETGRNTRDGAPAPIHSDFIAAIEQSRDLLNERADSISKKLSYVALLLERAGAEARAVEEATAGGFDTIQDWAVDAAKGGEVSLVTMAPTSDGVNRRKVVDSTDADAAEAVAAELRAGAFIERVGGRGK